MDQQRRVGIVTGGAAGIGFGLVRHLVNEGMAIIGVDRDRDACLHAESELANQKEFARVICADISTVDGAHRAAEAALAAFGRIDVLCNNAAVHPFEPIAKHSLDSWRETFRVNVDGALLCCQAVLPHMRQLGAGSIINIGSISGVLSYAGGAAYAASKAAVAMFTKTLALEEGPHGIRVNCISPGSIRHRPRAQDADALPSHIPIGRYGTADDVAHLVAFLASDASSYMTGTEIVLDGGATAGRPRVSKTTGIKPAS